MNRTDLRDVSSYTIPERFYFQRGAEKEISSALLVRGFQCGKQIQTLDVVAQKYFYDAFFRLSLLLASERN